MNRNYVKSFLFSSSMLLFCLSSYTQDIQNSGLKPITTPLKKESPRFTTVERPILKNNSSLVNKASNGNNVNSNTVFGEGKYLMFTKKIMEVSTTGQIPEGFPKHIKGQTKEQYVEVMKTWANENKDKIKPEYHNKLN